MTTVIFILLLLSLRLSAIQHRLLSLKQPEVIIDLAKISRFLSPADRAAIAAEKAILSNASDRMVVQIRRIGVDIESIDRTVDLAHETGLRL
jgi:hypothetical protein